MGLDDRLPPDWRVAVAVAVGVVALIGWGETRMGSVAEASVSPVRMEAAHRKETVDAAIRDLRNDAQRTRSIAEALLADCHLRGGCRDTR